MTMAVGGGNGGAHTHFPLSRSVDRHSRSNRGSIDFATIGVVQNTKTCLGPQRDSL